MNLSNVAKTVLRLFLFSTFALTLLGGWIGSPHHIMLGMCLGAIAGVVVPGAVADLMLRSKKPRSDVTRMVGAVHGNEWIPNEAARPEVEYIRGAWIAVVFGTIVGSLFAGYEFAATLPICVQGAVDGSAAAWLLLKMFD